MSINRLSRWAVVQLRPLMFTMTGVVTQLQQAPEFYGCRLEFDVNTQADRQGVLENMPTVIDELIEVGKELAAVGDVP